MEREKLLRIISQFENYIPDAAMMEEGVSSASIGWHIDHSLLVVNIILGNLASSDPDEYKWSFNFWRMVCLTSKQFPRGRAKAPKKVTPLSQKTKEELHESLSETREMLQQISNLQPNQFIKHPYFGMLKRDTTFQFLEVHTLHHVKIIEEIKRKHANATPY